MSFLVVLVMLLLLVLLVAGSWLVRLRYQQAQLVRIREQARLKAIESQIAALRAALRISVAEHAIRRTMQARDVFRNQTDHEEYRAS